MFEGKNELKILVKVVISTVHDIILLNLVILSLS